MAKIKWSAIGITAASGKSGGSVFSHNRYGAYVRNIGRTVNPQSARQTFMRSLFGNISQAWGQLSPEQINQWRSEAANIQITDGFGGTRNMTGYNYFMRVNQNRTHGMGLPITDHPLPLIPLPSIHIIGLSNASSGIDSDVWCEIDFEDGQPNTEYTASIGIAIVPAGRHRDYGSVKNKFANRIRIPFITDQSGNFNMILDNETIWEEIGIQNPGSTLYIQVHTHSEAGQKSNPVTQRNFPGEPVPAFRPFIFEIDTTLPGATGSTSFAFPVDGFIKHTMTPVSWNDPYHFKISDGQEEEQVWSNHMVTFANPGVYRIEIWSETFAFQYLDWGDFTKITKILQWGDVKFGYLSMAMQVDPSEIIDTPDLTLCDSLEMLYFWNSHPHIPFIEDWELSIVQTLHRAFQLSNFNQNINNWYTLTVEDFSWCFRSALQFNKPLDKWQLDNAYSIAYMFDIAIRFDKDISGWNVSNVINMDHALTGQQNFNYDLSSWDVSKVTNMESLFADMEEYNQDLSGWCVANVTNTYLFADHAFNWILPKPNFANPPC